MGSDTYVGFIKTCVGEVINRPIVQRSIRGKIVRGLFLFLQEKELFTADIALLLTKRVYSCISSSTKYKLPSTKIGNMWNAFHRLRSEESIKRLWCSFLVSVEAELSENELALQLLLDMIIKKMLSNQAGSTAVTSTSFEPVTDWEKKGIRYMSGYVAVSLLHRYKKPPKSEKARIKFLLFVSVLKRMCATDQTLTVESLDDYTRQWSELIDRGGLFHINDKVCDT